ncbi:MAG: S8 family serine peptidase [Bacteroidales bacterium]|nr:S8 family serine peptidase [Bacteroidales bacterium]
MMRFIVFAFMLLSSSIILSQAIISPELNHIVNTKSADEIVEVNIFFKDYSNIDDLAALLDKENACFDKRVKSVVALLKENSKISISAFYKENEIVNANNKKLRNANVYWGVNMLNVEVNIGSVIKFSEIDIVEYIDVNSPRYKIITGDKPENISQKSVGGAEKGLKTINAHLLWELGYTGRNVLFLSMDTGVFPNHPAISDNFCGAHFPMEQCWYGVRSSQPADNASSSHGTHTTGTALGLDRATNDTIGVAFNSMWIASDPVASSSSDLLTPTDFMDVFQWVLDPDGNPETTDDVPKVINNSWGYDYNLAMQFGACELPEAEILVAIETAGICSPFSAGNEGPGVSTTGFPAMLAFNTVNPMAVGALEPSGDAIASFSSRGPTLCIDVPGQLQIKPEVSAPGVSVRSCIRNDEYGSLSGTSMACPHVSGALLLLAEAFPQANAFELKDALYQTAIDLGEEGEDNTFGRGLIDVMAAYDYLAQTYTPEPPVTNEYDLVSEILSPELEIICPDQINFISQIRISNKGTSDINNVQLFVYLNETIIVDSILEITLTGGEDIIFETEDYQFTPGKNYLHTVVKGSETFREYDRFNNADIKYYYVIQEDEFPYQTDFNQYAEDLSDLNWLIQNPDNLTGWKNLSWGNEMQNKALGMEFFNYQSRNWEIDFANLPIIGLPDNEELYFSFTYAYKKELNIFIRIV